MGALPTIQVTTNQIMRGSRPMIPALRFTRWISRQAIFAIVFMMSFGIWIFQSPGQVHFHNLWSRNLPRVTLKWSSVDKAGTKYSVVMHATWSLTLSSALKRR